MTNKKDIKPGIYKHYKGEYNGQEMLYEVMGEAHHSETLEDLVVYKALYECKSFGKGSIWVRPKSMFLEDVEVDGGKKPRFEFISEIEKDDAEDKYKRAIADYQNLLKRTAQEKQEFAKYANEMLILEMLPVYDNMRVTLAHIDSSPEKNAWAEGVKYVIKQMGDTLKNAGVEEIKTVGEKFDPTLMEAMSETETEDEKQDGLVAKEVTVGYKLNGKIIKAARVEVYKKK